MADKSILVYIEGEGGGRTASKRKYLGGEFRKAWKEFLKPIAEHAARNGVNRFRCIPGRGGQSTIELFARPLPPQEGALRVLLIDSEGPVNDVSRPWAALRQKPPEGVDDGNCYLMVQCLETWLLADVEGLRRYYDAHKKCFNDNKVSAWPDPERIARDIIQDALLAATSACKSPYAHADGNLLIAVVDRDELLKLRSVARLFRDFVKKVDEYVDQ
jgi:hypothetical protein